ncbi:MAG: hypothetical protein NTW19_11450 [Planctomycetota bacterium]|nr:hypothetical protein [Planctomycetota bacterium]
MPLAFACRRRVVRAATTAPVERYRADAQGEPLNVSLEITGPGDGIRCLRQGGHDFSSFSELAKTLVRPGMSDLEKAMAVYRFSAMNFHGFGMGWGNTEMTRFINAFGYSFCWGQGDFQHLLYEAAGLRTRAPSLVGHSSVEVLIDGRWRLFDAFMRIIAPAPDLEGLATGAEMAADPKRWEAIRRGGIMENGKSFWSKHGPAGTYEPWQDSRAMVLSLRRGESLRFDYRPGTLWCMAPFEPDDYVNGQWRWKATLDETHLQREVQRSENIKAVPAGLASTGAGCAYVIEHQLQSPYPMVTGMAEIEFSGPTHARIAASIDGGRTWADLHVGTAKTLKLPLDEHLSSRKLGSSPDAWAHRDQIRHAIHVGVSWDGKADLTRAEYNLAVQAHRPSLPRVERGVNAWAFIGGESGAAVTHVWEENPGLRVSNDRPYEGEPVAIEAEVHNRGTARVERARVRFVDTERQELVGEASTGAIEPGGRGVARLTWAAAIPKRERHDHPGVPKPYLRTTIEARIVDGAAPESPGDSAASDAELWRPVARAVLAVRPRPTPHFNDALLWSSRADRDRECFTLRAAVVHQQDGDAAPVLYLIPATFASTLTPYLGHPDRGGLRLAEPRELPAIPASEFAIAEWEISTHSLPAKLEVWVEARCRMPFAKPGEEDLRLLARREISLD